MANESWLDPWKLLAGIPGVAFGGLKVWWSRKDEANRLLRADLAAEREARIKAEASARQSNIDEATAREAFAKLRENGMPVKFENSVLHAREQRVLKLLQAYCARHDGCADSEFQEICQAMAELAQDISFEADDGA